MAAPNIRQVQTLTAELNVNATATTIPTSILTNAANSGQVFKIKSVIAANVNATVTYSVSVGILRGGILRHIISTADVPADSSLPIILEQIPIYLEEGDALQIYASASAAVQVSVTYEVLS